MPVKMICIFIGMAISIYTMIYVIITWNAKLVIQTAPSGKTVFYRDLSPFIYVDNRDVGYSKVSNALGKLYLPIIFIDRTVFRKRVIANAPVIK